MDHRNTVNWGKIFVSFLRVAIGWHFLYEGLSKIMDGNWTAYYYLANTTGFLSGFYHFLVSTETLIKIVDIINVYGLILIGLSLFVGIFIRYAAVSGFLLLALYYFAYPPFGNTFFSGQEGQLYIVDKNFIEAMALLIVVFLKNKGYGIDSLREFFSNKKPVDESELNDVNNKPVNVRREVLKNLITIPILGVMGVGAINIQRKFGVDVTSGATIRVKSEALSELKGTLPKGKLGNFEVSRLVMGGNLINGYAHSRDLIYVNSLFKAYNTEKKIFETLNLAENAGINTISIGFGAIPFIAKYKKITGSKITLIGQVGINKESDNIYDWFDQAIDFGVDMLQLTGNWCDWLVRDGKTDIIGKMLEHARQNGLTAGLGAHTIDSLIICEGKGIIPDYYMKTMHHDNYWSAHPRENRKPFEVDGIKSLDHNMYHDNCFDTFPDRTIEFVNRAKVPVMGFKVLAAGAIKPEDGFRWAFENGADFICVGMFDFQIVSDVNITMKILNDLHARKRDWFS